MVDTILLEKAIEDSGKRKGYLAKQMGITIQSLRKRCIGQYDFKSNEIDILCSELGITKLQDKEKIFFKK